MFEPLSFRGFSARCSLQRAEINPAVKKAGINALPPVHPLTAVGDNGGMMEALMMAARLRRKSPRASLLTQGVINVKPFAGDVMASTLADLLNAGTVEPQGSPVLKLETTEELNAIGMCAETGPNYARLFKALGGGAMEATCEIFALDGLPVAVRKGGTFGVPSAMTLETIRVNGFDMPPGSITRLVTRDVGIRGDDGLRPGDGVVVRDVTDIDAMAMMRIDAIALPYEGGQRSAYFPYERPEAREYTLDIARAVLTHAITQA